MKDLLARIDELRRAGRKVMGDSQWILSGDHVLLRKRHDWRRWSVHGLLLLLLGWGWASFILPGSFDAPFLFVALKLVGDVLIIFALSGLWTLLPTHWLALNWRQQAITRPLHGGKVVPVQEVGCIVGATGYIGDGGHGPSVFAVLRNGCVLALPDLLRGRSLRRNAAAYGFVLDKLVLYLDDAQWLTDFWNSIWGAGSIDLGRLWTAGAERLDPYAWRDQ